MYGTYLNCEKCPELIGRKTRASWKCGWVASSEWWGHGFPAPAEWPIEPTVCPGYSVSLPKVREAACSSGWFDKGLLKERYDGEELTGLCMDAIDYFRCGVSEVESFIMTPKKKGQA